MSKKEKTALVPRLRFPEFGDSGEWSISKLGNISKPIEKRAGTKKYTLLSVTAGTGLVSQLEKFGREIAGNAYKNYYVIQQGDFAYNKSSTKQFPEGYISMLTEYEEGAVPNSIFTCFRITDKECFSKIFDYLFQFNLHGVWLRKFIAVGARSHGSLNIDDKYLWELPVALPKYAEQQKIADCLSSLDALITAEDKKLSALEKHKKGLMQKLFPAEGETVPEWRFPEFQGEWIITSLANVIDRKIKWSFTGGPFGSNLKSSDYTSNGIRVIQLQNIGDGKYIDIYRIFTSEEKADELLSCNIYSGEIIMSKMGDPVGRACLIPNIHTRYLMCSDGIRLVVDEEHNNKYFIYSLINSDAFRTVIENNATGSTRKRIGLDVLKNLPMVVPKEKEEQTKIADCLSSLDNIITAQSEKIEALKFHKKGLMQGLFPSIEEVKT